MEGSHSGLVRRLGKAVGSKGPREFESPTFRPFKPARRQAGPVLSAFLSTPIFFFWAFVYSE